MGYFPHPNACLMQAVFALALEVRSGGLVCRIGPNLVLKGKNPKTA
jgi:hypothetical protein